MKDVMNFRIHGDNIVECERIVQLIVQEVNPINVKYVLLESSTPQVEIKFSYLDNHYEWRLELLPGFNKKGRSRWPNNIFTVLGENGSFLNETPDAIITSVKTEKSVSEEILLAIEFCSAIQAGNQAWQRSGRAYSTARATCPYIYIVDFPKYELDPKSRERKSLRLPNPVVPYSFYNYCQTSNTFVAQIFVKSEEFRHAKNTFNHAFPEKSFGDKELGKYLVYRMMGFDTAELEKEINEKSNKIIEFLADETEGNSKYTSTDWQKLLASNKSLIDYSAENRHFCFRKKISNKGHHGKSAAFVNLVEEYSSGCGAKDIPFGVIPAKYRQIFSLRLKKLYPAFSDSIIKEIGHPKNNLVIAIMKGFKPRGDDNRPDRGILPLASMCSSKNTDFLSFIYGPILSTNYLFLKSDPKKLSDKNGFWKSVFAISDFIIIDSPKIKPEGDILEVFHNKSVKKQFQTIRINKDKNYVISSPLFHAKVTDFQEDDVDTAIHFLFTKTLSNYCFEGMCNPPGGDWSSLTLNDGNCQVRWLSLPRISKDINGKRPDHVIEINCKELDKPLILVIESKEKAVDLEPNVGPSLINYLEKLMTYIPNVQKRNLDLDWSEGSHKLSSSNYHFVSAAAYLSNKSLPSSTVFKNSNCDLLFVMKPREKGWDINIIANPNNKRAQSVKDIIISLVKKEKTREFSIS